MNINEEIFSRYNENNDNGGLRILENDFNKDIDFSKNNRTFYDNLYLNDAKIVIKAPLPVSRKEISMDDIKIEEFNLTNSIYILSYD